MTKQNIIFLIVQILVAICGLIWIILKENYIMIGPYLLIMFITIIVIYFNYSFCCIHNKMHSRWHTRSNYDDEPSSLFLIFEKCFFWFMFALGLFFASLP